MGDEGAIQFGNALKVNNSLKKLNLRVNAIGDKGALGIANGLNQNSSLLHLDLGVSISCV